ncbi:T9SS outer membrane translocon Sov/SprA [Ferruginibacter albus]|uniref:T9SS outer membrane translocon Sov/SprA n=1 Tax=Ferruginibacter albus TaxID=2875540 RepID=UPI001CC707C7|nr:cell surface protein SprA [Ferruginibacter albus]UAY52556.1 cell surface protein SprA [Ferruginibacter albus]
MLFKRKLISNYLKLGLLQVVLSIVVSSSLFANPVSPVTYTNISSKDSLPFPISDRRGDYLSTPKSTFDLKDPSNIQDSIAYDPQTHLYTVYEKIGDKYYRTPTTYTFDEYWAMVSKQQQDDYFKKRANTLDILNRKITQPKLSMYDNLFNRLFGNGKIDIIPQGSVNVTAGYQGQKIGNPTLPEQARNSGGLDFNMDAQVNVNANIGDKMKFPINYNTLANFGQENQLKLDYTGIDDEIVKKFEAGNVSYSSRSTLIPGAQQLFGVKAQLQFGKLFVTAVLANQKSQRQSVNLQGGAASQVINLKADEYEENRHFLLAQYFRRNYNKVLSNLPAVTSPVQILRMEVWVTNHVGTTTDARTVVGLADLAEDSPYLQPPLINVFGGLPNNNSNDLLSRITSNPSNRDPSQVSTNLQGMGLFAVQDFEKTFARKLDSTQYVYNRQVGYISLSQPLQPDEVLAVAYQYSYNGKIYQVGEFSQDVPPDSATATQKVLFLKLLKATSQRPGLPIWKLMMKNVYSVGYGTLSPTNFKLDVLYQEPSLGAKRYVPFGDKNQGQPIISLLNLDRLNNQLDPQPDGVYDYVEGYTVISQYSRIVFPVLEPFGRDLASQVYNSVPTNAKDTLFYALYDSIKAVAQQYPNLNRFQLKGSASTSGSSDISIGYNIPRGSVTVTAGGQTLVEGTDYDINYDLGTIKIINQAVLNAGLPVQVNFENNNTFGLQQRSYTALRLDYMAKNTSSEQLSLGATMVKLSERPFFTKVNYGEDPIDNVMYGLDASLKKDLPRITKLLDKLPFYSTTTPTTLNAYAEGALFKPGHAPQIGNGSAGAVYIDDFEGSATGIDLRFPAISWALASTPLGATDANGNELFPEAGLLNNLDYGKNRAKLAWYQIEPTLQQYQGTNNPLGTNRAELSDPRVRIVYQNEIFPQKTTDFGQSQLVTFDLAYYPKNKGPYNFDITNINNDNTLKNPETRWGGLMRSIDQTDFETANIQFIEFWMQDPYISNKVNPAPGKLYFNLGDISEDILKDGRRFYENGLPTPTTPSQVDNSVWGKSPRNPIQPTNAFSNNADERAFQDVGFDGLPDDSERVQNSSYLLALQTQVSGAALQAANNDPDGDDYRHYRDAAFTGNDGILSRYKDFNSPEGNSPVNTGSAYSTAATLYPDGEDLNRDNTMNETEQYFQYVVNIAPSNDPSGVMEIGKNFIVDKKTVVVHPADGSTRPETWYQFRIPISAYNNKVGSISDFKSIRFMRMFLTGFSDSIVLRFGELQLERNTWRNYQYQLDSSGNYTPINDQATFNVGSVNIEQNDQRAPLPYRTPKDIQRQQVQSNNGVNLLLNEQSMTLQFCSLPQGASRGVFETFAQRDFRSYGNLAMYIHAEANQKLGGDLKDTDMVAIVRIGSDFVNNYYEIKIPLYLTPLAAGSLNPDTDTYNDTLWRSINNLNLDLSLLPQLKEQRNINGNAGHLYSQLQSNGQTYSILGDPNLGEVDGVLIGVKNVHNSSACGEMWVDELRLSNINEHGGYAAVGKLDMNLADLGTISASVATHSNGFGTLEQKANERFRDDYTQFDVAANLELGKLLPKKAAISIPVFASYTQSVSTPEYDPYDLDIKLQDKLDAAQSSQARDSIRNNAVTFNSTKTINFTNVKKNKTNNKKSKIYDISNFDLSYSFIQISSHDPLTEYNDITRHRANIGYNFTSQPSYIEPFKKLKFFKKKNKSHWLDLVKDFNFNLVPSQISFRTDIQRQFGVLKPRSIGISKYDVPETYNKYFTMERDYIFRWNLTRSLNFNLNAVNNSRVDEPYGRIDTKAKSDTLWNNFWDGGRNTNFNQTADFSYTLPTSKFPALDWTTVNLKYQATYQWIGASLAATTLGNILENGQQQEATAQLDFTRLYNKSKFLRALDMPQVKKEKAEVKTKTDTLFRFVRRDSIKVKEIKRIRTRKIKDPNAMPYVGLGARIFGKLLTSIKQVNISLSENANTRLPGYTDSTQYVGQDWKSMQPGLGFILGQQPDTSWLNAAASKGLITKDTNFNSLFQQTYTQRLTLTAQLEPVRDLNISINVSKSFNKNYSETFKYADTTNQGLNYHFGHLTPYTGGGFDISYISFGTLFGHFDPNQISQTFINFENYRKTISKRLGIANKYNVDGANGANTLPDAEGYYYGYSKYATDVLIPAFIAAYSGKDPNSVGLLNQSNANIKSNPFSNFLPEPNWKIDYNGLSKIKGFDKIFTSFTLSHGYTGDLSMNGFTSALLYQDVSRYGYPSFYDPGSKNYVPYFLVPNITIQEQFSPLIGMDMTFTNQWQVKFEYIKQRTLSLSLVDYQLSETRSTEFSFGAGYRKRGLKLLAGLNLPKFLSKSGGNKLDNEINFRVDVRVRDNATSNSWLDQDSKYATSGSKEITISPTVDYYLNSKVNIKLYFDQRQVIPYVSSSAPITTTRAGVQVRISLAQ